MMMRKFLMALMVAILLVSPAASELTVYGIDSQGDSVEGVNIEVTGLETDYSDSKYSGDLSDHASFYGYDSNKEYRIHVAEANGDRENTIEAVVDEDDNIWVTLEGTDGGNEAPNPSFKFEKSGLTAEFDASESNDPDGGSIQSYSWDFGDSNTESTESSTISHTYDSSGTYSVSLEVEDDEGQTADITQTITVEEQENQNPDITLSYPDGGKEIGQFETFRWSSSDPENDDLDHKFYLDDDETTEPWGTPLVKENVGDSEEFQLGQSLEEGERYSWGVIVTDGKGGNDKAWSTFTLNEDDTEPTASFTVTDTSPVVGQTVDFNAAGSSGDSLSYDWDFGDGASSSRISPSHSYESQGTYTVTLTVTEPDGDSDTATEEIDVERVNIDPPEPEPSLDARFSVSDNDPEVGQSISFNAGSSTGNIEEYNWFFGDGLTASGRTTSHVYGSQGSYDATLIVEDVNGNTDTFSRSIAVDEAQQDQCNLVVRNLELDPHNIAEGEVSEASLPVTNLYGGDQQMEVEIRTEDESFFQDSLVLDGGESQTFRTDVTSSSDKTVTAEVTTQGQPCGSETFTRSAFLEVTETGEEEGSLEVEVEDEENDNLEFARIEAENGERHVRFTDSGGDASFSLEPDNYDVEVSKLGYETETEDVDIDAGETENLDFHLERTGDQGSLTVLVEDSEGERLEDVRVDVENGDEELEYTDSDGRADFLLEPDEYDVTVSKNDYRTEIDEVDIDEAETDTVLFSLEREEEEEEGLAVTDVSYSSSVCREGSLSVDLTIENRGGFHESVTLTGTGLGSNIVKTSFSLQEGDTTTRTLRFTDVEGAGTEEFTVTANNHDSDSETREVNVESCSFLDSGDPTGMTMDAVPDRTVIGNAVKVQGYVDGVRGSSTVEVSIDGERKLKTSTQPDGFYQVFVRPEKVGRQMVRADSGRVSASQEIEVVPTANVNSVQAPRKVFEGESFEVCADVNSQVAPKVVLERNNRIIESRNQNGEVCFEETAEDPGTHLYSIKAFTYDQASSASTTVEVLETKSEVKSFPDKLATVESEEGLVKVELYNTNNRLQRYGISMEGVPSTWYSQSEKEVLLSRGESETVYFYLTPREEISGDATLSVTSRGSEIFRQDVRLEVGGIKQPREKSFFEQLFGFLG